MAFDATTKYIAEHICIQLGIGSELRTAASANDASLSLMNSDIFNPAGGDVFTLDGDQFTYTEKQANALTGIPTTGADAIGSSLNEFSNASPDIVIVGDAVSLSQLDLSIKRYREYLDGVVLYPDVEKSKYFLDRGWLGTDVELRDSSSSTFNVVTADSSDYERGEFTFTSEQSYSFLYVAGWAYNPFYAMADIIETLGPYSGLATYLQIGQSARAKKDIYMIANDMRRKGAIMNF